MIWRKIPTLDDRKSWTASRLKMDSRVNLRLIELNVSERLYFLNIILK